MTVFVTYPVGDSEDINDVSELEKLYAEKDNGDEEHFGVSLTNDVWVLSLNSSNTLIWENLEDEKIKPKHLKNVSRGKVIELWQKLFYEKIDDIDSEPWMDGYF